MQSPAHTFDREAHAYRRFRPGYPQALADLITEHARLAPGCRILELGCGAGQATPLFAHLLPHQTCLDAGPALLEQCRAAHGHLPHHEFVCATFEAFAHPHASFDLLYAATSFHWFEPGLRFTKSHDLLKPGGCLAVFTDRHLKGRDQGFFRDVQTLYAEHAPELVARPRTSSSTTTPPFAQEAIERNPLLHIHASLHDRELVYTSDEYVGLLHTFSNHIALGPKRLSTLCEAISGFIDAHHGGRVTKILTTSLDIYRKP